MGAGIAQVLALAGATVRLQDIGAEVLKRAEHEIRDGRFGLASAVGRGRLDQAGAGRAAAAITYQVDLAGFEDLDLVIEAVPENLALKIAVFRQLDSLVDRRTILASNSSGFPIAALAAATDRADRVIGWHWASPAPVMKLAELVRTPVTAQSTIDAVTELAVTAGRNPIVVNDLATAWGYVANRIYAAMYREARQVIADGVATADQVDQLLVDCFRWPTGPFGMSAGAGSGWSG
jgi:3-hydroxybutyryl-CoA dehydrogenase